MSTRSSITIKEKGKTFSFGRHWDGYPGGIALDLRGIDVPNLTGLELFKVLNCYNEEPEDFSEFFYEFDVDNKTMEVFGYQLITENGRRFYQKNVQNKIFSGTILEFIDKAGNI